MGTYGDATPFTNLSVEDIARELEKQGLERYGNEIMYNSQTGEQISTVIFCGPTYYQRLKHMTNDKIHCLTEDHEVLTTAGWVPIAHVTLSHQVATLQDGQLVYAAPFEILHYPNFKGLIYEVKSANTDIEVTLDHKMCVASNGISSYELVQASKLVGQPTSYKRSASWKPADPIENLPLCDVNMDEPLPSWFWNLNEDQCRQFIDYMLKQEGFSLTFKSLVVANDWQRLCLHAGWWAVVEKKLKLYLVHIYKTEPEASIPPHERVYQAAKPVYCLTVPGSIFYVRRNGRPCWTGNSRAANGPVVLLTRQPAEGRARDGGLRLGEMENECLLAHGVASFFKERFMECSDNYRIFVCKRCGMMANVNPEGGIYSCKPCNNTTNFCELRIPYSCKLLFQEIQTMSIGTRFIT
jgi:hypothetical protein